MLGQAEVKAIYDPELGNYPYPAERGNFSDWYWMLMRIQTDAVPALGPCAVRALDRLLLVRRRPKQSSFCRVYLRSPTILVRSPAQTTSNPIPL
eukprot:SAG11_NODE_2077_length_3856_cov_2.082246_5_plen_94_part_00